MMIGAVNGVSYRPYKGLSFGTASEEKTETAGNAALNETSSKLSDNFYTNISKNSANNAIRHALFKSKGREEKDGKLNLAAGVTLGTGFLLVLGSSVKNIFKAPGKTARNFIGAFTPSKLKKHFVAKVGIALLLAGIGINLYNNLDAKKTAKQRGVKDTNEPITSPELQRLQKESEELSKKQNEEMTRLYSAEYDANMAVYQKVLADAPMKYASFKKPAA